ncbi:MULTISPECIES: GLPGLI family protein [Polaribacter]|uniref:GLPGLI family protein n=1 Tax=Polaribacter marinaquae TaxID=1642819 RepID=A0ABZ2TVC1_9FLAO|nr:MULTISPECIES: GLPGLI family protein [unclassified Polaribacter]AQS95006.1 ribonuclease Z [Polaribacter sp. BM10]SHM99215.1 GLPGLI family protein [Polaribacter sp. KT 15]
MKQLITLFLAFVTIGVFAQKNFQGKATYMSKTTLDMSSWGGRMNSMSEAQKKQIADRMKSMLEKTFILSFDKTASIYKEDEKLEAPGAGGGFRMGGLTDGGTKYKNTKELVALESKEFFGKNFLISDTMEMPQWELGSETKKIGNYICYKATLTKDVDATDWRNMRRRNRDDDKKKKDANKDTTETVKVTEDIEIPKKITVTAWYTPQIPVSNGPGEYWGLPGLILEINEGRTTILCTEIVLNPSEKLEIEKPTKGDKVTRKEYTDAITKKMEEFRNSRGRGRGGRGRF